MYLRFRGLPSMPQGQAHVAMPNHEGGCRLLFLGECEEMGREIATEFSIECHVDGGPAAVENRKRLIALPANYQSRRTVLARPLDGANQVFIQLKSQLEGLAQ